MNSNIPDLQKRIHYHFKNESWLHLACTHASQGAGSGDNQRLEFLGDAVLGFVVAEALYTRFPESQEGALDHMRAGIVNGRSLTRIARQLDLGAALVVSEAHRQHLPEPSNSMLEDALEALIGAIYQDDGMEAARSFIMQHFKTLLDAAKPDEVRLNPKGRLQEWTQKHHEGSTPVYEELKRSGPDHDRVYVVQVSVAGEVLGQGKGGSIKDAERVAAQNALHSMSQD